MEYTINIKGHLMDLSTPQVMGILNVTPDSFYSGSRKQTEMEIAQRANQIIEKGGSIIDVGAFSTRPGADEVSEEEEGRRLKFALDGLAYSADIALLLLSLVVKFLIVREVTQSPDDDTCHEDDATHLLQVLLTLFPGMAAYRLPGREAVRRQLHHEWGIFALHHETGKDAAQYHGKEDADEIERYHDE